MKFAVANANRKKARVNLRC